MLFKSNRPIFRYVIVGFAILLVGAAAIVYAVKNPSRADSQSSAVSASWVNSFAISSTPVNSSPVSFSSLRFPKSFSSIKIPAYSTATIEIIPFSEEYVIQHSDIICKATVLSDYEKEYKYETYYTDAHNKIERLPESHKTFVYEIRVDDLYYNSKAVQVGDRIKVEGNLALGELTAVLQQNHQYILNLYDNGEKAIVNNYASGNINRDGRYDFCYAFVPQIEVTLDQQYIFHDGWKGLMNNKAIDVVYDKGAPFQQQDTFYQDKMKLRQDKDFISDYKKMIAKYK